VVVAVVVSASSLHRELERKTLFPILARPIKRAEYLVGKYLGTLLTIWVFILIDAAMVLMILAAMGGRSIALVVSVVVAAVLGLVGLMWKVKRLGTFAPIPWALVFFAAAYLLSSVLPLDRSVVTGMSVLAMFEVAIVTAFAMVFSSFSSPFLSALLTLGVFVMGRQADNLARLPAKVFGEEIHRAGVLLSKVVPNLQVYVPAREIVSGEAVDVRPLMYVSWASVQAVGWSVGLMVVAALLFRKRDFL
jgi:ABC-type Na+ efflux pump permease subunit